jgi:hypothetical protein
MPNGNLALLKRNKLLPCEQSFTSSSVSLPGKGYQRAKQTFKVFVPRPGEQCAKCLSYLAFAGSGETFRGYFTAGLSHWIVESRMRISLLQRERECVLSHWAICSLMLPTRRKEMRNTLVITGKAWFVMMLLIGSALAQSLLSTTPPPPMTGPTYDFSTGYSYLAMPFPGAGQSHLNGLDASGSIGWNKHWGATLDANVFGSPDVPGTGHQAYVLNTQCGPEFYPFEHRKTRFFVRALGGSALIDAAIPAEGGSYHGWLLRPSLAFGGGFEQPVSRQFGIRVNADYLRTLFSGPIGAALPENNLRLTVSLVIRARKIGERVEAPRY